MHTAQMRGGWRLLVANLVCVAYGRVGNSDSPGRTGGPQVPRPPALAKHWSHHFESRTRAGARRHGCRSAAWRVNRSVRPSPGGCLLADGARTTHRAERPVFGRCGPLRRTAECRHALAYGLHRTEPPGSPRAGRADLPRRTPDMDAPGQRSRDPHHALSECLHRGNEERPGAKHVLVQSTLPLQAEGASGQKTPVSVTLRDQGSSTRPKTRSCRSRSPRLRRVASPSPSA